MSGAIRGEFTPQIFQAQWDSTNEHLKDKVPTTWEKVGRVFWNILSVLIPIIGLGRLIAYGLGCLAKRMILPSAYFRHDAKEKIARFENKWRESGALASTHTLESHKVRTPDGAELSVRLLRVNREGRADADTTIIRFNPNFGLAEDEILPPLPLSTLAKCNVVSFNYRGVGKSTGSFEASKDLVVDGFSIVQWVQAYLNTEKKQIHFMGTSLGGAFAAQVQALDPALTGCHVNDRSLASTDAMLPGIARPLAWIVNNQGYGFDAAAAFRQIQGKKLVIYHPQDEIIPYHASLHAAVQETLRSGECLSLKAHGVEGNYHNTCLSDYERVEEKLAAFLQIGT